MVEAAPGLNGEVRTSFRFIPQNQIRVLPLTEHTLPALWRHKFDFKKKKKTVLIVVLDCDF